MKSIHLTTIFMLVTILYSSGCSSAAATQQPTPIPTTVPAAFDVIAEGRVEPIHFADLALNTDGSISELPVSEGELVEQGQVIISLKSSDARTLESARLEAATELASAYQALHDAQSKLDDVDIPAKFSGMTAAEASKLALANLNSAREAFEPYKYTDIQGYRINHKYPWLPRYVWVNTEYYRFGPAHELKKALDNGWVDYRRVCTWLYYESAVETAKARIAQAQKDYDSLQDPTFAEDTAGVRAALANAEVRAPFAGTVTNLDLKVGEYVTTGQTVATIADLSSWVVKTTDLTEIDVVHIKEGQPVQVTLDAVPEATLNGHVLSIGQNYSEEQSDIVYEVKILLTDAVPDMRWGMTAVVRFKPTSE